MFKQDLAQEQTDTLALELRAVLKRLFPSAVSMRRARNLGDQKNGIDVWVNVPGRPISLDFKFRGQVYEDFCLEFSHDRLTGECVPGWVADDSKQCDLFAYIFKPIWQCWLLPRKLLQRAWREHNQEWQRLYFCGYTDNGDYVTNWCAVPIDIIKATVGGVRMADQNQIIEVSRDPREHWCLCGKWASFGIRNQFFCAEHKS